MNWDCSYISHNSHFLSDFVLHIDCFFSFVTNAGFCYAIFSLFNNFSCGTKRATINFLASIKTSFET